MIDRRSETQKEECERCLTNRVKMRVPEGIAGVENTLNGWRAGAGVWVSVTQITDQHQTGCKRCLEDDGGCVCWRTCGFCCWGAALTSAKLGFCSVGQERTTLETAGPPSLSGCCQWSPGCRGRFYSAGIEGPGGPRSSGRTSSSSSWCPPPGDGIIHRGSSWHQLTIVVWPPRCCCAPGDDCH